MKQQLSALIDGEYDLDNAEHLLLAAKSDGEVAHAWATYHMIGDVMRGDSVCSETITTRVLTALESEATVFVPSVANINEGIAKKSFYKSPMMWSMAASVAAVMFVGLMLLQQQTTDQTEMNPVEIADNLPAEYLQAHQVHAPNSASYYIQNAAYTEQR